MIKNRVFIEGFLLLVLSFVALGEALHLIWEKDPQKVYDVLGPGHFILVLSLALMAIGASHLIVNLRKGIVVPRVEVNKEMRNRMIGMALALALYTLVIDFLGYLISTVLFFLLEFRIVGIKSWRSNIMITIVLTAVYYIVFIKYCEMVFPRGIF
jgi:putative tricarboxylic transport membrane protein